MSGTWSSFVPGLVVLAIGLAAGLLLTMRLRRSRAGAAGAVIATGAEDRGLELERADLLARRDEIYTRLRADDEDLSEADRHDLERAAARTLRHLDGLEARVRPRRPREEATPAPASAAATLGATPTRRGPAHPAMLGFAFGAGFAALAALLVYWAARDATPRPPESSPAAAAPGDPVHSRLDELSPEARARVGAILSRLAEVPEDLEARKALTETFVVEGLFFEAFEQSERILEQSPGDVDGLYFQGLIRLTMGQDGVAIELLDRALASEPAFVSARLVRGLARLRGGDRDAAIEDWRRGLEAAGGSHDGLERLLVLAESGASAEEILGSAPPEREPAAATGASRAGAAEPGGAAPAGAASASDAGEGAYRARIELAPGATAPPAAVLFVNLRIVAGAGPPSAVKRIAAPRFPIEITLDANDAMPGLAGRPLPESGFLSARLDGDGDASTRDPSEPSAQVEATIGVPVTLVLR
ncbi:MAG TPA: hypothetical protein VMS86_00335 [Thermoanaerobaculia bacterium]|nr:hypothetical protein [Thermoanaerobaculia bacterium]